MMGAGAMRPMGEAEMKAIGCKNTGITLVFIHVSKKFRIFVIQSTNLILAWKRSVTPASKNA